MANRAKLRIRPNSKVRIKQVGLTTNRVVARLPRGSKIRIKA